MKPIVLILVGLLAGCVADPAAITACGKACAPRLMKYCNAETCQCDPAVPAVKP